MKIVIRIREDFVDKFKTNVMDVEFKKKKYSKDCEKVEEYGFDIIDYDNHTYGEFYPQVKIETDEKELLKKIEENFEEYVVKKSAKSYSITIPKPFKNKKYTYYSKENIQPKYPICILSLGRYEKELAKTSNLLNEMKIKHYIFVEPFEYNKYKENLENEYTTIIQSIEDFHKRGEGGYVMRNYINEYVKNNLGRKYWLLDDNIKNFVYLHHNRKHDIRTPDIFRSVEEYTKNIKNLGLCSLNFSPFITETGSRNCLVLNGKNYSCLFMDSSIPIKWDGKYNEDVILSIRYVNAGYVNICFNHFLYEKNTSGTDKGGNTSTIYKNGYDEKYDFLYSYISNMINTEELKLLEGKGIDDFIKCKSLKGKPKHHQIQYKLIKNKNDKIEFINNEKGYEKIQLFHKN